jgi:hypothetical protein
MTTSKAIATLVAIVVVVVAFIVLTLSLGIQDYWAGFLFLFYWGTTEHLKLDRLPYAALGSVGGLTLAMAPAWLTPWMGAGSATAAMIVVMLLCIFALIKGVATLFCNSAMMLFLTVATIPAVVSHATPTGLYSALVAGILFFGGLSFIAARVTAMRRQDIGQM